MTPSEATLSVAAATRMRCALSLLNAQSTVAPEPVPELCTLVQVSEGLEAHDAQEAPGRPIADGEPQRPRVVPVAGAGFAVAPARVEVRVERHPGQPLLEVRTRRVDRVPQVGSIGRFDRNEEQSRRIDRTVAKFGARRNDQHVFQAERTTNGVGARTRNSNAKLERERVPSALPPARVGVDERARRPLDALEGARDELARAIGALVSGALVAREVQGFAGLRVAPVGRDAAVREEAQATVHPAPQRQMALEKVARPAVTHGDAEPVAEVVLGVPRHEDTVATALGPPVTRQLRRLFWG